MAQIRTAVVGVGYLGSYHAEKYAALPDSTFIAVADIDRNQAIAIARRFGVTALTDYHELLGKVDAVSVVVPTVLHFEVADFFLRHGVHVLVDKPMTTTVEQAEQLIRTAKRNGCVLQVGHLERFNAAIVALKGLLNQPLFIESHRLAPFKPRGTDVNVVLDLMIHDIDIILSIVNAPIRHIMPIGVPVLTHDEDIANARLEFANGCVANVTASRVSTRVERKMRIFQPDAYISVDLQEKRVAIHRKDWHGQAGEMPNIVVSRQQYSNTDALYAELQAFLQAIQDGTPPMVTGEDGKQALEIALEISAGLRPSQRIA